MKRKFSAAAAVLMIVSVLVSVLLMSGCDDFKFNPIGKWQYTDDIALDENGNEFIHVTAKDMQYQNIIYTFEKSGTGYMSIENGKAFDFTYEYDDKTVTIMINQELHFSDSDKIQQSITYDLSEDGRQLILTTPLGESTDKGTMTEQRIYTRI